MTERPVDLAPIADLYRSSLARHGPTPPGAGWRTLDTQELRFERLATVLEPAEGGLTVNDVGCGYGAFFEYLASRGIELARYHGYDIAEEMLSAARERLPDDVCELVHADRATLEADYSFASGIFNVRLDQDEESWSDYVRGAVRNLAEHSRAGFAFNLLSTYCDYREPHLYYGDPLEWFDWCKREVTPRVSVLHDYPLFEWTIVGRPA